MNPPDTAFGESLLAVIGIRRFLDREHPRVTVPFHERADRIPKEMGKQIRAFIEGEEPEKAELPEGKAFSYMEIMKALSRPVETHDLEAMIDSHKEPEHALDLLIPLSRALAYLNGICPRRSKVTLAGAENLMPSDQDVSKFRRLFAVVNDPMTILRRLQSQILLSDEVTAFIAVYPALYQVLFNAAGTEIANMNARGKKLPYRKEKQLSLLLQIAATDPAMVADLQATFEQEKEAKEAPASGPNVNLKAGSFKTPGQAMESQGR